MRILQTLGLIGLLAALPGSPARAHTAGDEKAREIAEQTLAEGALITRIAPITVHDEYKRAHEHWHPHSKVQLRRNFTPELQKSVGAIPG